MKTISVGILLTLCFFAKAQDEGQAATTPAPTYINCDAVDYVLYVIKNAVDGNLISQAYKQMDAEFPMPTQQAGTETTQAPVVDQTMNDWMDDLEKATKAILGNSTSNEVDAIFKQFGLDDLLTKLAAGNMNSTEVVSAVRQAFSSIKLEDLDKALDVQCPYLGYDTDAYVGCGDCFFGGDSYGQDSYDPYSYGQDSYDPYTYGQDSYDPYSYGQDSYDPYTYGQESYDPYTYGQDSYGQDSYGGDSFGDGW